MLLSVSDPTAPEVRYSQHISQNGQFLGLADIALLSTSLECNVVCAHFDNEAEGFPSLVPLFEKLSYITDGMFRWVGQPMEQVNMHSEHTCVLGFCQASFEKSEFQLLNHAFVLHPRAQMDEKVWQERREALLQKLKGRVAKFRARLDDPDSDDEPAVQQSLKDRHDLCLRKQHLFETCLQANFIPVDVPCDGNCVLWSMLNRKCAGHRQELAGSAGEVQKMRTATCQHLSPTFVNACHQASRS